MKALSEFLQFLIAVLWLALLAWCVVKGVEAAITPDKSAIRNPQSAVQ